jgi:hypothetical protein
MFCREVLSSVNSRCEFILGDLYDVYDFLESDRVRERAQIVVVSIGCSLSLISSDEVVLLRLVDLIELVSAAVEIDFDGGSIKSDFVCIVLD